MAELSGYFRTTVNMRLDRYENIEKISCEKNIRGQKLIKRALKKFMTRLRKKFFADYLMRYQPKGFSYKPFHVTLTPIEYDRYIDLKKIYRFSLSFLIAMALDKYLDDVIKNECEHEACDKVYTKIWYEENGILIYTFCWGFPVEFMKSMDAYCKT